MTIKRFAASLADYIETNTNYKKMSKRQAIIETVKVLSNDEGAFNQFLAAVKKDKAFKLKGWE